MWIAERRLQIDPRRCVVKVWPNFSIRGFEIVARRGLPCCTKSVASMVRTSATHVTYVPNGRTPCRSTHCGGMQWLKIWDLYTTKILPVQSCFRWDSGTIWWVTISRVSPSPWWLRWIRRHSWGSLKMPWGQIPSQTANMRLDVERTSVTPESVGARPNNIPDWAIRSVGSSLEDPTQPRCLNSWSELRRSEIQMCNPIGERHVLKY